MSYRDPDEKTDYQLPSRDQSFEIENKSSPILNSNKSLFKYIVLFIGVFLFLIFAFIYISNRLDNIHKEIDEINKKVDEINKDLEFYKLKKKFFN